MYQLEFRGQWLSLNAVYTKHHHQRNIVKKEYQQRFRTMLLGARIPELPAFRLRIEYNSRMDCDNLTAGTKVLVDTMRELGIIREDNKHIYKGISIEPNLELAHNTYQITIIPEEAANPVAKTKKSSGKPGKTRSSVPPSDYLEESNTNEDQTKPIPKPSGRTRRNR
ncbi:hypothetical protein [Solirubrum puertoriconensis]|uniref:Uncharacterized protein n=1 Tax=Solirubrum puertoriconensis TaxID=1751427 RepID=A0A9X0HKB6_SOLP1|nr:hypothetical protein [Solirubrum puertoriconensis]KUG07442.1 hypothetical protein ASU33_13900 [Solirubrum puertoriconensis]